MQGAEERYVKGTSNWSSCSVSTLRILISLVREASSPTCISRTHEQWSEFKIVRGE